jgi:hypothetical protein
MKGVQAQKMIKKPPFSEYYLIAKTINYAKIPARSPRRNHLAPRTEYAGHDKHRPGSEPGTTIPFASTARVS